MPNTFGFTNANGDQQVVPLYDPTLVRGHRDRFNRPLIPELRLANCLYMPANRWPARGWILLNRNDYNQIPNLYAENFQLNIDDFINLQVNAAGSPNGLLFQNLAIVNARCVSRGRTADTAAVYLVELTDARGVLYNRYFAAATSSQYNVLAPAYPGQYYTGSLDGGIPWTWDGMVGDLWEQMPELGPYPGLPTAPAGTPTGFSFPGVSAWLALCRILDLIGLQVSCDLTDPLAPYGIVQVGVNDASFVLNMQDFVGSLEENLEYIDAGSGRVPGTVTVYFHRINQYYGTEETVRADALQWQGAPFFTVPIPAGAPFTNAQGNHHLWDDFPVRFDANGFPLAADVTMAQTIAQERSDQYYDRIARGTSGYLRHTYAGALPFVTGPLCDGVCWYQREGNLAWRTEVVRGPGPPWPEVVQ
jgi:hypothetical protein